MATSLMDLIKQKKADIQAQTQRQRAVNIPSGSSEFRILPGWRGENDPTFWHDFGQHFIKDKSGQVKAVYVCSEKTFGRPCPVCDAITSALHQVTDDETSNLVKGAVAGSRVLVNALHVDGQEPNKPVVLALPPTVFAEIVNLMESWMKDGVNILSLAEGHDLSFNKTGSGLTTRYTVSAKPRSRAVPEAVMQQITNLDEYVSQESEEQARRAISNINAVAGVIGAPVATAAIAAPKPSALADLTVDDDLDRDVTQDIPTSAPAKAAPVTVDAVAEKVVEEVESTGDSELDDLLSELNV